MCKGKQVAIFKLIFLKVHMIAFASFYYKFVLINIDKMILSTKHKNWIFKYYMITCISIKSNKNSVINCV